MPCLRQSPSQPLFGLITQHLLFLIWESTIVWQDQITVGKEIMLTAIPLTERNQNYWFFTKRNLLVAPKTYFQAILRQKADWKDPNQKYIVISYERRYTKQGKRIIFQRGLLDWLLPTWIILVEKITKKNCNVSHIKNGMSLQSVLTQCWEIHRCLHCPFKIHLVRPFF